MSSSKEAIEVVVRTARARARAQGTAGRMGVTLADWIGIGRAAMDEPDASESWAAYGGWLSWEAWAAERINRWIDVETAGDRPDARPLSGEK